MGNLCLVIECDLHVMRSDFSLITTSSWPHLTIFLHVCGQLEFSENFYSVSA